MSTSPASSAQLSASHLGDISSRRRTGSLRSCLGRWMRPKVTERASSFVQYFLLPVTLGALWEVLCRTSLVPVVALPPPSKVGATLWALLASGQWFVHVGASLLRVVEGFALAAALGIGLGVCVGISATFSRLTDFLLQVLRPIPPIAWIPLAILWMGIGEASKVYIIFLGAFFPVVIGVIDGIRHTDHRYVEVARVFEATRAKLVRRVVLPGALPTIITGLRIGLGNAWVCVVAAELIAAERGVGYIIVDGREMSRPDLVIAGMISIGVIGKLMDIGLHRVERRLLPWRV